MKILKLAISIFICAVGFTASTANAATFTVNSTDDIDDGACNATHCSLREAVNRANAATGGDTIDFDGVSNVQLTATLPDITTTINIIGGSGVTVLGNADNGVVPNINTSFRAFLVTGAGNLSMSNITVSNAKENNANGGGLLNQTGGTVSLTNCAFNFNAALNVLGGAGGAGGGISNNGTMTLTNTEVSFNDASVLGGGIFNGANGALTLTESTVAFNTNNTASTIGGGGIYNAAATVPLTVNRSLIRSNLTGGNGGGIFNNAGVTNITNSTLAFNSAFANNGGGFYNFGTTTITNSTITDQNFAQIGGGIFNDIGSTVNLRNTIVAENDATTSAPDVSGAYAAPMFNLIGKADGSTGFVNNTNGNKVGTIAMPRDPLLAPIANNGGATQTYALLSGSPAVNAGSNALATGLTTDQRGAGFPRIINTIVDIGSFESAFGPTAASVSIGGQVMTAKGRGVFGARVEMINLNGEIKYAMTNPSGFYRFADAAAGGTFILSVKHKRYTFAAQVINLTENNKNFNFTAEQ